jgi:hypothetical protein
MLELNRRNMNATKMGTEFFSYIAVRFDEIIEDMLAVDWGEVDAQDAVDLAEIVYAVNLARHAEGRPPVALPLTVQRQINECAKRGMHKGQGKGRPRDSRVTKLFKEAIVDGAKDLQRELYKRGTKNLDAQWQAAEEASDFARKQGLKLKADTIKRMMENISDK